MSKGQHTSTRPHSYTHTKRERERERERPTCEERGRREERVTVKKYK